MRRIRVAGAAAVALALALPGAHAADHLLITEFSVIPSTAEFVELHNPTASTIDLSEYYLTDFVLGDPLVNYWRMVDGVLFPDPSFPVDFLAKFPDGSSLPAGGTVVVALQDDLSFSSFWSTPGDSVVPDFELTQDADAVPGMFDPGPGLAGVPYILSQASLSNSREVIVLFRWDGQNDLVEDVDMVQWSNVGPDFFTVSPNKTGVTVDGPDGDLTASAYLNDTAPVNQDLAVLGAHASGMTVSRIDLEEGAETATGGNGLTGHDETSEPYSVTWQADTAHSIGFVPTSVSVRPESWGRIKQRFR